MFEVNVNTNDKMIRTVRRIQMLNRILIPKKKMMKEDRIILNETCGIFCRHNSDFTSKYALDIDLF